MDDSAKTDKLVELFGKLSPDIVTEFLSMLRIFGVDEQELFFKWEAYCIKMGPDNTKLNLDTVLEFKNDAHEQLEKTAKAKVRQRDNPPRTVQKTPRHVKGDGLALLDSLVPTTPRSANGSVKRKFEKVYDTPSKSSRLLNINSPSEGAFGSSPIRKLETLSIDSAPTSFSKRTNAGTTIETLNGHIPRPTLPLPESALTADRAAWDNRVKLAVSQEVKKFSFRPMHQKLTEAAEVQDDRIEALMALVQEHHQFSDEQFGNPSTASPSEVVVVGRIASDSLDGKLNAASVVLESSRRMGAGSRVPLKLDAVPSYSFFPGQIVAMRGVNASGEYFAVSEILEVPYLPPATSSAASLAASAEKLAAGPLSIVVAAGPYTTDDNLLFESLDEICNRAAETCPDVLILLGPFIDTEHPLIKAGDFDIEGVDPMEGGTIEDLFREKIGRKISKVERSLVIIIPSIRDAVSKHVAYPQEPLKRKKTLGLSPNVRCLPNPSFFSLNEIVFAISTPDVLFHLSREEVRLNPRESNPFARLSRAVLAQQNFYPLFPPPSKESLPRGSAGVNLDVPNLRLADFVGATPDVLVLPSMLAPSTKVVDGVVAINPGNLSKRAGAGSFAALTIGAPGKVEGGAEEVFGHKVYERARVEVLRI